MDSHQQPPAPALVDYPEAGRILGNVSRSTVKALIANGSLASITIGRRRLIPRAAIDRFIAERLEAK